MQTIITQAAIQTAQVAEMALKVPDTGPTAGTNMANTGDAHRCRHSGPALRQSVFDWKAMDRCIVVLNFEMEVMNILQTRAWELNSEEKVPVMKIG